MGMMEAAGISPDDTDKAMAIYDQCTQLNECYTAFDPAAYNACGDDLQELREQVAYIMQVDPSKIAGFSEKDLVGVLDKNASAHSDEPDFR